MNDLAGQTLCMRYQVKSLIGRGGMADVYRVWDKDRAVDLAMKLLREDLAQDRVFLRRFKREANNLRKLQHPNIVRYYGLEQEGLLAFILMDYVEGATLRTEIFQLDGTPMTYDHILEILQPICSALHFAHRQGIVHCDLKPGNVMIHKNGTVLVTDFGVARMMDSATVTLLGAGTPAYMAPEIVAGREPSPETDIYALGVILFEMLTGGERPFAGDLASITGSTGEKVRWEQVNIKPPSPGKWNIDVSEELEKIVLKCLEKSPGDRYTGALNFLKSFESALDQLEQMEISIDTRGRQIDPDLDVVYQPEELLKLDAVSYRERNINGQDKVALEGLSIVEEVAIIDDEPIRGMRKVAKQLEGDSKSSKEQKPVNERESEDIHSKADQIMARKIFLIMIAGILVTFLGLILLSKP